MTLTRHQFRLVSTIRLLLRLKSRQLSDSNGWWASCRLAGAHADTIGDSPISPIDATHAAREARGPRLPRVGLGEGVGPVRYAVGAHAPGEVHHGVHHLLICAACRRQKGHAASYRDGDRGSAIWWPSSLAVRFTSAVDHAHDACVRA